MSDHNRWGNIPQWGPEAVASLLECLKVNDFQVYEHCLRVGEYSRKLARDLGLSEYEQRVAEYSGLLHDIGKMGIHKTVLHKMGRLDPAELEIVKDHVIRSEQIVKPLTQNQFFKDLLPAIRGHHERMDGEGYPDKKAGEEIPLLARVVLVVDTFDAMSVDRSYRRGLPIDLVFAELKRCSGTQFDSQIVKTFLEAQPFWNESTDSETENLVIKRVA